MKTLITAYATPLPSGSPPSEFLFLPEGKHRITPQSHPQGIIVDVPAAQGHAIAAKLQSDLERRMQENVKPWLDFEHTRKFPASGYPQGFRYEPGRGIVCRVEWSGSGSRAIVARDVGYFSPEVYVDSNGVPTGLPERGPWGGLVTEPAYRNMPALALAASSSFGNEQSNEEMIALFASDADSYNLYLGEIAAGGGSLVSANVSESDVTALVSEAIAAGAGAAEDPRLVSALESMPGAYDAYLTRLAAA